VWRTTNRTRDAPRHRSRNWLLIARSWEQKTRNHQCEPRQARVCRLPSDLTPPPRSRGRGGARGHLPSDGAGGSPLTARVRNHGIGVATDDFSHTHGVERHKTISASPKPPQVRRGCRPISDLAPPERTRALEGREVPEGTWPPMAGGGSPTARVVNHGIGVATGDLSPTKPVCTAATVRYGSSHALTRVPEMPEDWTCPPAAWVAAPSTDRTPEKPRDRRRNSRLSQFFERKRQGTTSASPNKPMCATIWLLPNDAREGREVPEDTCPPMARVAAHRPHAWWITTSGSVIGDFSHIRGVERHETTSASPSKPECSVATA